MKKLITSCCALFFALGAYCQTPTFQSQDLVFNVGIGLGSTLYHGFGYETTLPAISVSGEYGVQDDFLTENLSLGIGGFLGFAGSKYEEHYIDFEGHRRNYGWKYSYTVIGVRGVLHYPLVDKLDTYGGLMLGANIVSVKEIGDFPGTYSADGSSMAFSGFIGGRYYFTEQVAGMMEIGYGVSWLNIGVSFKI